MEVDKSDDLVPYVAWTIARQLSYKQAIVWKKPVGKRLEALNSARRQLCLLDENHSRSGSEKVCETF
jgi:hypothetical protein